MPIEKRIKKGDTEWITDPILYLAEGKVKANTTKTDADRGESPLQNKGRGSVNANQIEFPYKTKKIIRRVLLALIPEIESKAKIDAFLKRQRASSKIVVHGRMNVLCSFLYHLADHRVIKAETQAMEELALREFKFFKTNGKEVIEGSIKNVFKRSNQKKKPSQLKSKTANKGARLAEAAVIDKIFLLVKGNDATEVRKQLEKWFS